MVDFQWYTYENTEYTFTHVPENLHLTIQIPIQTPTAIYYVSDDDNKQLWKYIIATGIDSQLDIDPGDASGDNKSRLKNIRSLFHDKVNNKIYGVDSNLDWTTSYLWVIDLSDDSVIELDNLTPTGAALWLDYKMEDVFIQNSKIYIAVVRRERVAGTLYGYQIWEYTGGALVLRDTITSGGHLVNLSMGFFTIVSSAAAYCNSAWIGLEVHHLLKFDSDTNTLTSEFASFNDFDLPGRSQQGIAYDGNNILYYILEDLDDNILYFCSYTLSVTTFSQGPAFNIALMLDRNNIGTANSPYEYEKGFHITSPYIYSIVKNKNHYLKLQDLDLTGGATIKVITDKFCIDSLKNVYEYTNSINDMTDAETLYGINTIPRARFKYSTKLSTDQLIEFYQFSGNISIEKSFSGKAGVPRYNAGDGMYHYNIVNQGYDDGGVPLSHNSSAETCSSCFIEILGKEGISYLWTNTTATPALSTTITYRFNKSLLNESLYLPSVIGNAFYSIEPNGYTYFRKYSDPVATGLSLTVANTPPPTRVGVKQYQYNSWDLRGGISSNMVRFSSKNEDSAHILEYGKRSWEGKRSFPGARAQVQISAIASAMTAWQGMQDNPPFYTIEIYDEQRIKIGTETSYQNSNYTMSETEASYLIVRNRVDLKSTVQTITITQTIVRRRS